MSRPRFRAFAGITLAASLLAGGFAAFAADTSCNAWTDKKGDSSTDQSGLPFTEDSQLDIVGASLGTVGDSIVGTITTDGLSANSSDSGDEFAFDFFVAGVHMLMYVDRTVLNGQTLDVTAGFFNQSVRGAPSGAATAKFDVKTKTVTITGKISELAKSAVKPVMGEAITKLKAQTSDQVDGAPVFTYDDAPTTISPVVGTECGGGAPAAEPSPSAPAAGASPSPSGSASASASPAPSGSAAPAALPIADCGLATDPKGDAKPLNANNPNNDPDLDLTRLTLGTVDDRLVAYAKVDKLAAGPTASTDGHRFTFYFTHNKHVFAMAGSAFKTAANASLREAAGSTGQFGKVTQLTVDGPPLTDPNSRVAPGFVTSGLKFTFDKTNSYVIASVPIADIDKYGKAPFAGAELTGIYVTSATDTGLISSQADVLPDGAPTTKPSTLTYTAGDSSCFAATAAPAAAPSAGSTTSLVLSAPSRVQTSDPMRVSVFLKDGNSEGKPIAGGAVTAQLGSGSKVTGKTNNDGFATLRLPVSGAASTRTLVVSYAGGDGHAGKTVRRATTVLAERSLLSYVVSGTGSTRLVRVTLSDDDSPSRHPYAGATVTFAYSGKTVTAKTDSAGQAFVRVKVNTKMDMRYAGRAGYVTSAFRQTTVN